VLTGDDGAAISAELRHDPINIQTDWQLSAQPYAFVDAGWVWSRGLVGDADNPRSLVSSGAGLRMALGNRARLDVSGAVALKTAGPVQAGDVRFLMTLTTRILPWSTAK
jgi:hemolysin activation/secretion protein